MIKEDRQKSVEIIDDSSLIKDDAIIVLVSMVKKKGHIVNKNLLTLANFFDFANVQDIIGVRQSKLISKLQFPPSYRRIYVKRMTFSLTNSSQRDTLDIQFRASTLISYKSKVSSESVS